MTHVPDPDWGDSTRSVFVTGSGAVPGAPVAPPPVPAAAYHLGADETAPHDTYGRSSNPGWRALEAALAALENGCGALSFGSGMAALTSTMRVLTRPGCTLVVPADGYYQVRRYACESLAPLGVHVVEAAVDEMLDAAAGADVVLAESPVNPLLDVLDLRALARVCRARGAVLVVDNTAATPFGQRPLDLGADLVAASATKALSGHSDVVAGYVTGTDPDLLARIERDRLLAGAILGPLEAWLVLRSMGSAGLRFERQCQNAAALAGLLAGHPAVSAVRYPGLVSDPAHAVAAGQMAKFGGLLSIELVDAAAVHRLIERSTLAVSATSFGGLHTTVDRRARWGDEVAPGFARISAGIEDTADLLADFAAALDWPPGSLALLPAGLTPR